MNAPLQSVDIYDAPELELLLDDHAAIAESPTWSPSDGALYWIDIKEPGLHRLGSDGARLQWTLPSEVGAFALLENLTGAVVALRNGLYRLAFGSGEIVLLAPSPFNPCLLRFNEGVCDARGRFWVGVMFDPLPGITAEVSTATLQSFTLSEGLRAGSNRSDLHNGFAWNAAADRFYWSHSNTGSVFYATYDAASGVIGPTVPWLEVDQEGCLPDGAAMDEEGCYWCAIHGGSALHRFDRDGHLMARVRVPISQPTMCAFVGADLDWMVVTSAREKLSHEQLAREPHAGGLFRFRPGVRGLPRPCVVR